MNKAMYGNRLHVARSQLERAKHYFAVSSSDYRKSRVEKLSTEVILLETIVAVIKTATIDVYEAAGPSASLDVLWWKRHHKTLVGRIESANKHLIKYPHLASKTTHKLAGLKLSEKVALQVLPILVNAERQIKELRSSK